MRAVLGWGLNYHWQACSDGGQYTLAPRLALASQDGSGQGLAKVAGVDGGRHFSVAVTEDGEVVEWGQVHEELLRVPRLVDTLGAKVSMVAAGEKHAALLTVTGSVLTWGCGIFGRLGHGHEAPARQPKRVLGLDNEFVVHVDCGGAHSVVATSSGQVYAWGFNRYAQCGRSEEDSEYKFQHVFKPRPLAVPPAFVEDDNQVARVQCGKNHTMLITRDGDLLVLGQRTHCAIGVGVPGRSRQSVVHTPRAPVFVIPDRIWYHGGFLKVAGGGRHTLALAANGCLFAFGAGNHGQLGLGDLKRRDYPTVVPFFADKSVVDIAAGRDHSLAVVRVGAAAAGPAATRHEVYLWGIGFGGGGSSPAVAFEHEDVWALPRLVSSPLLDGPGKRVVAVACGDSHCLVVVEDAQTADGTPAAMPACFEAYPGNATAQCLRGDGTASPVAWAEPSTVVELPDMIGQEQAPPGTLGSPEPPDWDVAELFSMCRSGRLSLLQKAISDSSGCLDARDELGNTLLICAARNGQDGVVQLLADLGADLAATNAEGIGALEYARLYKFDRVVEAIETRLKTERPAGAGRAESPKQ